MFDSSAVLHVMSIMVYEMTCYFTVACQLVGALNQLRAEAIFLH